MLKILSYYHSHSLAQQIHRQLKDKAVIVCPNPRIADEVRSFISDSSSVDSLTISKFVGDILKESPIDTGKMRRKSDVYLELSVIWRQVFPDWGLAYYNRCFQLLTELRSFTLSESLAFEMIELLDNELHRPLQFLWKILDELEVIDEQKAYLLASESLVAEDLHDNLPQTVYFMGFTHLNSFQIHFLQRLASRSEVVVPYPKRLFQNRSPSDWVSWLVVESFIEEELDSNIEGSIQAQIHLSEAGDLKIDSKEISKIVFPARELTIVDVLQLQREGISFKVPASLFENDLSYISSQYESSIRKTGFISTEKLLQVLAEEIETEALSNRSSINYLGLKIRQTYRDVIQEWQQLSKTNTKLELFDFLVIKEKLRLDLPRLYGISLSTQSTTKGNSSSLLKLDDLFIIRPEVCHCLIIRPGDELVVKMRDKLPAQVVEVIASLGPIYRPVLGQEMLREKVLDILSSSRNKIYIAESVYHESVFWNELLPSIIETSHDFESTTKKEVPRLSYNKNEIKSSNQLSATKLQRFLDCPLSYAHHYSGSAVGFIQNRNNLQPVEIGNLQHEIIAKAFQTATCSIEEIAEHCLHTYLLSNKKVIRAALYQTYLNELIVYSQNGVNFLKELNQSYHFDSFAFEKVILQEEQGFSKKGIIDFYFECKEGVGFIDFKRSSGSIPSKEELVNFKKIQAWFYGNLLGKQLFYMGYLCLKDPNDSLVIISGEEKKLRLKSPLHELLNQYEKLEGQLIQQLSEQEVFKPSPRHKSVCEFCELNLCCPGAEQ